MSGSPSGQTRLIVNADDFGRAPGVSRGILEAHRNGIVTSTTLMANMPFAADALAQASGCPTLDVGLHLSFCYGPAVSDRVTSLLGTDGWLDRDLAALMQRATVADVTCEAEAQLARFVELAGRLPTHIDTHLHLHRWPPFREAVVRLARRYDLPVRAADPELGRLLAQQRVLTTDGFVNDFFTPGTMSRETLLAVVARLGPGLHELMVHPGYDDEHLADSSFRAARETELGLLTAPHVRAALAQREVVLTRWSVE